MALLLAHGFIVVDDNAGHPIIIHEWVSCASHKNSEYALDIWIADQMQNGKIKVLGVCENKNLITTLKNMGVPKRDQIYIRLACCVPAHSVVSNDIDLHDPTEKTASPERRALIMRSKRGAVCRHVKDTYAVNIIDWMEVPAALRPS
jgi:hypothetical protein